MIYKDAINFINQIEKEYNIESKNEAFGFLTLGSERIIDYKKVKVKIKYSIN